MAKVDWSFQDDAIAALVAAYDNEPSGRNLLVIPTGGGKTLTALRFISKLLDDRFLNDTDRVIWTVHSRTLRAQAEKELNKPENISRFKFNAALSDVVEVRMKDAARKLLAEPNNNYKLIIIDEAHHAGASTYTDFFDFKIGILGLTATPKRNDKSELKFDQVAYSITFRELIERGVVILPTFEKLETHTKINIESLESSRENDGNLNSAFNNDARNELISEYLVKRRGVFNKIIVFVPTNDHVDALYAKLRLFNKLYNEPFHVGYIYSDQRNGVTNDQGLTNEKYLEWHEALDRPSILINCAMLNEGYNDPNIDTVVLAAPTRSVLYYMQCVGRVVRNPGSTKNVKAYVIEVSDELPNFVYRVDNKWLFADISDYLEPKVFDISYSDINDFRFRLNKIYESHNVPIEYREALPAEYDPQDISLMLLKPTKRNNLQTWIALLFTPERRDVFTQTFNHISENIRTYIATNSSSSFDKTPVALTGDSNFSRSEFRTDFLSALRYAYEEKLNKVEVNRISYYNFFPAKHITLWQRITAFFRKIYRIIRSYV
jgi:superfamily II DNA or RNA helicase